MAAPGAIDDGVGQGAQPDLLTHGAFRSPCFSTVAAGQESGQNQDTAGDGARICCHKSVLDLSLHFREEAAVFFLETCPEESCNEEAGNERG